MQFKQNSLFHYEELIEYWGSAIDIVSYNSHVGPLPRIKFFFLVINMYKSTHINSKNNDIFPTLQSGNENFECESNSIS